MIMKMVMTMMMSDNDYEDANEDDDCLADHMMLIVSLTIHNETIKHLQANQTIGWLCFRLACHPSTCPAWLKEEAEETDMKYKPASSASNLPGAEAPAGIACGIIQAHKPLHRRQGA